MTKEEVLAMEAGDELDKAVAESLGYQVKSWETFRGKPVYRCRVPSKYGEVWESLCPYSIAIRPAWQVWLAVTKDHPEDWAIYSDDNGEVTVEHYPDDYKGDRESGCGDFSIDGLFPEAICKAALLTRLAGKGTRGVERRRNEQILG